MCASGLTGSLAMPHTGDMPTTPVKTYAEQSDLATGTEFSIRLGKRLSWRERHGIFYHTANRPVVLTLYSGERIKGTLCETPGYFSPGTKAGPRLWLRVPGRKTRKPVDIREVRHLRGFKAPTLAEAYTALIYLSA